VSDDWRNRAACVRSSIDFTGDRWNRAQAKRICLEQCPVLDECSAALDNEGGEVLVGVRAGRISASNDWNAFR
jgi:hypothetical protein